MKIKIIAKNETGKKAIEQHVLESLKLRGPRKYMLKKLGYSQKVTLDDPYTLFCEFKGSLSGMIKIDHFKDEVNEALKKNGADKGDYYFEEC